MLWKNLTEYLSAIAKKYYFFGVVHTIFLLWLTFFLQNNEYVRFDEFGFLKLFSKVKNDYLKLDPKPKLDSMIFIDVSKDISLTADVDPNLGIPPFSGAKAVITDRAKLTALFRIINQHNSQYKLILCDILFDLESSDDPILKPEIEACRRLYVTAILDSAGHLIKPVFNVQYGLVNYHANADNYMKLSIFYNKDLKSLPAIMYGDYSHKSFRRNNGVTYYDKDWTFNKIFTEFFIRNTDLSRQTDANHKPNLFYLGDLLSGNQDVFNAYLKDKYIVIGDFSDKDVHSTFRGKLPGALILWNSFLTLEKDGRKVPIWLPLFLFFFYFFITINLLSNKKIKLSSIIENFKIKFIKNYLTAYLSFLGLFTLVSIFTYFMLGFILSIFYMATYLTALDIVISKAKDIKNKTFKEMIKEL